MSTNSINLEERGQEGPIRCIFFSEFHHIAGPKITCQVIINFFITSINV